MLRRYFAELIGTFMIVFAPVSLSATSVLKGGAYGLPASALVSGMAITVMVYAMGPISAAHFNPAVTLGFAATGRFPWRCVPYYWFAQFAGAILASTAVAALFGAGHGTHVPLAGSIARSFATEAILSFFLMLVIIAVATDRRVGSTAPALAIGLTVVCCVFIGGPVSGGSMNPARSLGPAVFAGGAALQDIWLYLTAPFVGAIAAAFVYEALRLHPREAQGAPNEILEALKSIGPG